MQCSNYNKRVRCKNPVNYWLLHPDGTRNPGGYVCSECGNEIVNEYATKLHEFWSLQEINEHGHEKCLCALGSSLTTNPCDICNGLGYIINQRRTKP